MKKTLFSLKILIQLLTIGSNLMGIIDTLDKWGIISNIDDIIKIYHKRLDFLEWPSTPT